MAVTDFQEKVYALLLQIPPGRVTSYGSIARALHTSPRAVGNALRNNPFAPDVPCHRCVSKTGFITGFDGESIDQKTFKREKDGSVGGSARQSKPKGMKAEQYAAQSPAARGDGLRGKKLALKLQLLRKEGVEFNEKGMLIDRKKMFWDGLWKVQGATFEV
jgi:methylated-DNA-[protein]-cysteine S-methyltransferase